MLCKTCNFWVDCGKKNRKPHGFCLCEDLFTYTAKQKCVNYAKGTPMTAEKWEELQEQWLNELRNKK